MPGCILCSLSRETYSSPPFSPVHPVHEYHKPLPPGIACGIAVEHIKHVRLAFSRVGQVCEHDHGLDVAIPTPKYPLQATLGRPDDDWAVVGGTLQPDHCHLIVTGLIFAIVGGLDADSDHLRDELLTPQFLSGARGMKGNDFFHWFQCRDFVAERA